MALQKEIQLENGIIVNYHRIVSINKITNNSNVIEIASYTSKEKRQEEIDYCNSIEIEKEMNVYIDTTYVSLDYNEEMTIKQAYEYLKTTEKFTDAKNI